MFLKNNSLLFLGYICFTQTRVPFTKICNLLLISRNLLFINWWLNYFIQFHYLKVRVLMNTDLLNFETLYCLGNTQYHTLIEYILYCIAEDLLHSNLWNKDNSAFQNTELIKNAVVGLKTFLDIIVDIWYFLPFICVTYYVVCLM